MKTKILLGLLVTVVMTVTTAAVLAAGAVTRGSGK